MRYRSCTGGAPLADLQQAIRLFVAHHGLAALFLLLMIEEAGVWLPLPGDLLIVYFGYRAAHSPAPLLAALWVLLTVTAAVLCGATILYTLTRHFRSALRRLGRFIHLDEARLQRMERWLTRRGPLVIVPVRLIPGLRVPVVAVCGIFGVPLRFFLPAIALSALLWGAIYFVLGAAGPGVAEMAWDLLGRELYEWVIPALTVIVASAVLLQRRRVRPFR